jgi:hypothetical protein
MKRFAVFACLAVFCSLLAAGSPGAESPGDLDAFTRESWKNLESLYGVPDSLRGAPIAVSIVPTPRDLPPEWANLPPYAAGAAVEEQGRVAVLVWKCGAYPFGDVRQTLVHELSHVLLYRALGRRPPRWLDEGLAMRASREWGASDGLYSLLALRSVAHGGWNLARVERDFAGGESPVRGSYALVKGFVRDLFRGDAEVGAFLEDARRLGSVDAAFVARFGMTPDRAFANWAKNLPWWGEWLVWISSPAVLWMVVGALFLLAALAAFRRRRAKYEALPD